MPIKKKSTNQDWSDANTTHRCIPIDRFPYIIALLTFSRSLSSSATSVRRAAPISSKQCWRAHIYIYIYLHTYYIYTEAHQTGMQHNLARAWVLRFFFDLFIGNAFNRARYHYNGFIAACDLSARTRINSTSLSTIGYARALSSMYRGVSKGAMPLTCGARRLERSWRLCLFLNRYSRYSLCAACRAIVSRSRGKLYMLLSTLSFLLGFLLHECPSAVKKHRFDAWNKVVRGFLTYSVCETILFTLQNVEEIEII